MEFELTFLLLEQSKLECALDRCDHDVAYEYWYYVEMKFTYSRKMMAQPRMKNADFKTHVLGLCTKFVKQNIFQSSVVERRPDPHSVKTILPAVPDCPFRTLAGSLFIHKLVINFTDNLQLRLVPKHKIYLCLVYSATLFVKILCTARR